MLLIVVKGIRLPIKRLNTVRLFYSHKRVISPPFLRRDHFRPGLPQQPLYLLLSSLDRTKLKSRTPETACEMCETFILFVKTRKRMISLLFLQPDDIIPGLHEKRR